MKKILSLLLCFFFMLNVFSFLSATTAYASGAVLYTQGFETSVNGSMPQGLKTVGLNKPGATWTFVSTGSNPSAVPSSGSKMAMFNSYNAQSGSSNRLYMEAGIGLGNAAGSDLTFAMYHDTMYPNCADSIQVQVSTDGGSTWVNVGPAIKRNDGSGYDHWTTHGVGLDSFMNKPDVRIGFLATSQYGNNIFLDDISITGMPVQNVPVTGISLNKNKINLEAGNSEQLTASILPTNASDNTMKWEVTSQSPENVATVSNTGLVKATNPGTAEIKVTSVSNPNCFAVCSVNVQENRIILNEGFENSLDGITLANWGIKDEIDTEGNWTFVSISYNPSVSPKSGSKMGKFNSYDARSGSTRLYSTKGVKLGNLPGYTMKFFMYHDLGYSSYADNIQVQVSTDGGATWVNVGQAIKRNDGSGIAGWKEHIISLDQFINNPDVRIGFLATSKWGNNMYLDDISIINSNIVIPVSGVALNTTSASISVGQVEQLIATVFPSTATNTDVSWVVTSESASNVVTVSTTGQIRGLNPGTAVIRATSTSDPAIFADCAVTVTPYDGTIVRDGFETSNGGALTGWTVQQVSGPYGIWSAVSSGTPTVSTARTGAKMAMFNSGDEVYQNGARIFKNTKLTLDSNGTYRLEFYMYHDAVNSTKGDNIQVQICPDGNTGSNWVNVGSPINRSDGTTGWKKHTIILDQYKGTSSLYLGFLAMGFGGNYMYIDDVSITKPEVIVSLNTTSAEIALGQNMQLSATVLPGDLPNKNIIWSVATQSGVDIVTVTNGAVSALNPGTAVIRATSDADKTKYAECTVHVLAPVTSVSLNTTNATIAVTDTLQLEAAVLPEDAADKRLKWEIYSESTANVATVSDTGLVTAHNVGTAVIRVSSISNPNLRAVCYLTVASSLEPIVTIKSSTVIMAGRYEHFEATLTPVFASKSVSWSIVSQSTENVLTVEKSYTSDDTQLAMVSALNPGTAVIRATSDSDPSRFADCAITVVPPTWTSHSSGTNVFLSAVTYGNNKFVAVGNGGAVSTSTDGTTWSYKSSQYNKSYLGIAYGNGKYVAVGYGGFIATSTDGISWYSQYAGTTRDLYSITFGNGKFVAAGESGTILTSSDGVSWTTQNSGIRETINVNGITYGNGMFVAAGGFGSGIITSIDGVVWSAPASGISTWVRKATFGDGKFVVIGTGEVIYTSEDGVTWTSQTMHDASGVGFQINGIAYSNGKFVAVGILGSYPSDGVISTSTDGVNWDTQVVGTDMMSGSCFIGITYGNGMFVTVGRDGEILTSP